MNILIGLIPAVLWGLMPIAVHWSGGRPINQLFGTTYGAFLIAIVVYLIKRPVITKEDFWWCFFSGAAWAFGQVTQYASFEELGVSTAMPISTGLQLAGNSIVGVLFFGNWPSGPAKLVGFAAILIIIIGIFLTTKTDNAGDNNTTKAQYRAGLINLFVGTFGYIGFTSFPKVPGTNGWSAFLPQTLGMVIAALVFSVVVKSYRQQKPIFAKTSFRNISTGLSFGIAAFVYLISTKLNGISTGFTISQMCVIVSTLGGIFIIGESKTRKEFIYVIAGLVLVVIGGVMSGSIS